MNIPQTQPSSKARKGINRPKKKTCQPKTYSFPPGTNVSNACGLIKWEDRNPHPRSSSLLAVAINNDVGTDSKFNLARTIVPIHYTLSLKPNFKFWTYDGCVGIQIHLPKDTKSISLNAVGLIIYKIVWVDSSESRQEPFEFTTSTIEQRVHITFEPLLNRGSGVLLINFRGRVNEAHHSGLHVIKYNKDMEEHSLVFAKFSRIEARKYFPCFDEPSFKATFCLSLVIPKMMKAMSNMPIKIIYPHRSREDLHIVEFETTPKIPPCLLTLAIGEFPLVEEHAVRGKIVIRLYNRKHFENANIVHSLGVVLSFFEEYLKIPFPVRKLDVIIEDMDIMEIPENLGLLLLQEGNFFENSGERPHCVTNAQVDIYRRLSYFLSYQYFGNLVTTKSWSHFWLYEAFVTFMEYLATQTLKEQNEPWMRFINDMLAKAMALDCLSHSHALEILVHSSGELKSIADVLSRTKGASLIRMVQAYVGPTRFRDGLTALLTRFSFENASTGDFWKILEELSGKPVSLMMNSWSRQIGFPLVRILSCRFESHSRVITLHQEVFASDSSASHQKTTEIWVIPIFISTASNPSLVVKEVLMEHRTMSFKLPKIGHEEWFVLNSGMNGFFRVKYPQEILGQLLLGARTKTLPPADRLGLLNDLYAMARSGISTCVEVLGLLLAYVEEDNYFVWIQIDSIISGIDVLLRSTDCYNNFKAFVQHLFENIYLRLGWDQMNNEPYLDTKLRVIILTRLLISGHVECMEQAQKRFEQLMLGKIFPGELRGVFYRAGMCVGDITIFRSLIRRFKAISSFEEREQILESFGYSKDEIIIREVLELSLSETVSSQDTVLIIKSVAMNTEIGPMMSWSFFKERSNILMNRYPTGSDLVVEVLRSIIECFSTEEMHIELSEFFRSRHFPTGNERTITQGLEKVHNTVTWLKREKANIAEYLSTYEQRDI